jgi:AraC-like DNA-binding protein
VALVALTLGASRESREQILRRSLDPLRLEAIKDYVQANAARENLSVGEVAQKHGMSARHVQRLFEAAGITFSEFVLRERLAFVYLTMTDPNNLDRRISDIIFDAGFTDISHFNRAFRRRYGAPPSELRRQLKRGSDLPN